MEMSTSNECLHSCTVITIKPRHIFAFVNAAPKVRATASQAPGNVAAATRADFLRLRFWTYTIWEDAKAMQAWMYAGNHAEVMQQFNRWRRSDAAFVQWNSALRTIGWAEGMERLLGPDAVRPPKVDA